MTDEPTTRRWNNDAISSLTFKKQMTHTNHGISNGVRDFPQNCRGNGIRALEALRKFFAHGLAGI